MSSGTKLQLVVATIALAVVAGAIGGYRHWRAPQGEKVLAQVDGVSEITLQFDPTLAGGVRGPVMGLGYARWVNFGRVLHQGESFFQVGSGATLITRNTQPTRFLVREAYRLKPGPFGTLRYATLEIEDRDAGVVVATTEWLCGVTDCRESIEGRQGWPGQQAASFVRKVLNPTMPIGGNVGIKPYPRTVATFERQIPSTSLTRTTLASRSFGCPEDLAVKVRKDINEMTVSRTNWTFVAPHMIRQVRCTADGFFVFSTTFPTDIFIDWLSPRGDLLGQYHVRTGVTFPSNGGGSFPFLADLRLESGTLDLRMAYFYGQWPSEGGTAVLPDSEWLATISLDKSAQRQKP